MITYEESGVNRKKADLFASSIKRLTGKTVDKKLRKSASGYASLYSFSPDRWIAATTDGVGTKLKLAFELNRHNTIGIDLVAMSVNDLICVGAKPLFFLDYFATGRLDSKISQQVIKGIVKGCEQSECMLVGGETAEMPGIYNDGEYDLAGFAVGEVQKKYALPKALGPGDSIIGVSSTGFHSNGFSLLRKLVRRSDKGIKQQLLKPTRVYVKPVQKLIKWNSLKGMAHITGSGMVNISRLSNKVSYEIELPPTNQLPSVFQWLEDTGGVDFKEAVQTFNMGVGLVLIVQNGTEKKYVEYFKRFGMKTWKLGTVVPLRQNKPAEIFVSKKGFKSVILNTRKC